MAKLTPKQELFIQYYMISLNATEAALKAGYSKNRAKEIGYQLLHKPTLSAIINDRLQNRATDNGITADYVLQGIKAIADKGERENDKLKAYELLGKHLKLFTEKVESDNNHSIEIKLEGEIAEWAK